MSNNDVRFINIDNLQKYKQLKDGFINYKMNNYIDKGHIHKSANTEDIERLFNISEYDEVLICSYRTENPENVEFLPVMYNLDSNGNIDETYCDTYSFIKRYKHPRTSNNVADWCDETRFSITTTKNRRLVNDYPIPSHNIMGSTLVNIYCERSQLKKYKLYYIRFW